MNCAASFYHLVDEAIVPLKTASVLVSPLARIPDRFSQHRVKLALCEFLRLPPAFSRRIRRNHFVLLTQPF
jgi:hypothetical protein